MQHFWRCFTPIIEKFLCKTPKFCYFEKITNKKTLLARMQARFSYGALAEIRTPDTLIKSQVLYRLS